MTNRGKGRIFKNRSVAANTKGIIMEIKRFESNQRMSRAVVHGDTIYLCGQTSREETTMAGQTKAVLKKIEELLEKYGSDKEHILSTTIYVRDMALFQEMNTVWDAWTNETIAPARACVEAKMAAESILVEMSVIAALK